MVGKTTLGGQNSGCKMKLDGDRKPYDKLKTYRQAGIILSDEIILMSHHRI